MGRAACNNMHDKRDASTPRHSTVHSPARVAGSRASCRRHSASPIPPRCTNSAPRRPISAVPAHAAGAAVRNHGTPGYRPVRPSWAGHSGDIGRPCGTVVTRGALAGAAGRHRRLCSEEPDRAGSTRSAVSNCSGARAGTIPTRWAGHGRGVGGPCWAVVPTAALCGATCRRFRHSGPKLACSARQAVRQRRAASGCTVRANGARYCTRVLRASWAVVPSTAGATAR